MSHLETATFTNDDGTAINVPTSGVTSPEAIDPRRALEILLGRGWTPLTFPSEGSAVDAAKKTSAAWSHDHGGHSMDQQQPQQPDFWGGLLHAFLSGAKDSALNLRDDLSQASKVSFYNDEKFPDRLLSTLLSAATMPAGFLHTGDLSGKLMNSTRILRPYGSNPVQQVPEEGGLLQSIIQKQRPAWNEIFRGRKYMNSAPPPGVTPKPLLDIPGQDYARKLMSEGVPFAEAMERARAMVSTVQY